MITEMNQHGPHEEQQIYHVGKTLTDANAVLILLHGRGATAPSILELANVLPHPDLAYLAPQAADNTWYPFSFLAPIAQNEPYLSSALRAVANTVHQAKEVGIPNDRIIIGGFSQGACLAAEFTARSPERFGGLLAFSGGLIGPPEMQRNYVGNLTGTSVFLGCSNIDPHIPEKRVHETANVLIRMGATVDKQIYPNMGHTIIQDEIDHARQLMDAILGRVEV